MIPRLEPRTSSHQNHMMESLADAQEPGYIKKEICMGVG